MSHIHIKFKNFWSSINILRYFYNNTSILTRTTVTASGLIAFWSDQKCAIILPIYLMCNQYYRGKSKSFNKIW